MIRADGARRSDSGNPVVVGTAPQVIPVTFGGENPLGFICGPCVIESREHTLMIAEHLAHLRETLGTPMIFKSSYDKANRTSVASYRGLGIAEGLAILQEVRDRFHLPIVTDVHSEEEAVQAGGIVDLVQIPAFLCRQTDLIQAAGSMKKPMLIKKGQFLHPSDMQFAAQKAIDAGASGVLVCERGSSFGYRDLVVDMRGLMIMAESRNPIIFDATHSVQQLGGLDGRSGGSRRYVAALARAAVAVGVQGVFLECHQNPDSAPSDGPNMVPLSEIATLIQDLMALAQLPLCSRC